MLARIALNKSRCLFQMRRSQEAGPLGDQVSEAGRAGSGLHPVDRRQQPALVERGGEDLGRGLRQHEEGNEPWKRGHLS